MCLAALHSSINEDGRHTALIAFFVEQLPIYANWRDQQRNTRRYPQQHLTEYWRKRASVYEKGHVHRRLMLWSTWVYSED